MINDNFSFFRFFPDIDPMDDNQIPYGQDIFNYKLNQDIETTTNMTMAPLSPRMAESRKKLFEWLVSLAHHYNCSQETLYFTIDIFDRYLAVPGITIKNPDIQLIGVACYVMATKVCIIKARKLKKVQAKKLVK